MSKRDTREIIIDAAEKIFFTNGFEKTSVKMILAEANVVTGSFYHFFPSKEALFESVIERFLKNYTDRVTNIFTDKNLKLKEKIINFFMELNCSSEIYYNVLEGDKLHWTVQCALHEKTMEALVSPVSQLVSGLIESGTVQSKLDVDAKTLSKILIKGSEAVIHGENEYGAKLFISDKIKKDLTDFYMLILNINDMEK